MIIYLLGACVVGVGLVLWVIADGKHPSAVLWVVWLGVVLLATDVACWQQKNIWDDQDQQMSQNTSNAPDKSKHPAATFSARVKTIMWQHDMNAQPFFFAIPPAIGKRTAYAVSATLYLQLRNNSGTTTMVDSYSIEAKSDRDKWEVMQIWDVSGPGGRLNDAIYSGQVPQSANHVVPIESFVDRVTGKNLAPGETVQGLIFLTMPHDWMVGEFRMRIRDSTGENFLLPIKLDFPSNPMYEAQGFELRMLEKGVDLTGCNFVWPEKSKDK